MANSRPSFAERWRRRWQGLRWPSKFQGTVKFRGVLRAVKITRDGERVDYGIVSKHLVTQAFVKRLAAQMAADFAAADEWKHHASGTSSAAESNSQTALGTEVATRSAGTQSDVSAGTTGNYQTIATITYGGAFSIREHAVFNAAAVGTMMDRSVFAAITVGTGDSIEFTFTLEAQPE